VATTTIRDAKLDRDRLAAWVESELVKHGTLSNFQNQIAIANPGKRAVTSETIRLWKLKNSKSLNDETIQQLAAYRGEVFERTRAWLYGEDLPEAISILDKIQAAQTISEVSAILDAEIVPAFQAALRKISQLSANGPSISIVEMIQSEISRRGLTLKQGIREFLPFIPVDSETSSSRYEELILGKDRPTPDEETDLVWAYGEFTGKRLSTDDSRHGERAIRVDPA
jgi:hypothetical protein